MTMDEVSISIQTSFDTYLRAAKTWLCVFSSYLLKKKYPLFLKTHSFPVLLSGHTENLGECCFVRAGGEREFCPRDPAKEL